MMVKVLLYGYCAGVASSRRIAQWLHENIRLPWRRGPFPTRVFDTLSL